MDRSVRARARGQDPACVASREEKYREPISKARGERGGIHGRDELRGMACGATAEENGLFGSNIRDVRFVGRIKNKNNPD